MTKISLIPKKCVLCGETSNHNKTRSTNRFGPMDLDTRPPEMERSTINTWIERCPFCGYCASDISNSKFINVNEIVKSVEYQEQLNNQKYPELANSFLCWSLINEKNDNFEIGGHAALYAAWICDDKKDEIIAQECRKRAITLFLKAKENSENFMSNNIEEKVLLVDLFRRSGQFEEAIKICDEVLTGKDVGPNQELIKSILQFQKKLISESDIACHTIAEANKE